MIANDRSSGYGRKPIGPVTSVRLDTDAKRHLDEVAERFGSRRQAAVIRAALRRIVRHPDPAVPVHRYLEKLGKGRPGRFVPIKVSIDYDTTAQLDQLAESVGTSSAVVIRVAISRLLAEPAGQDALLIEGARAEVGPKLKVRVEQDALRALNTLAARFGPRTRAAAVRLAIRRVIADPGDLRRECTQHEAHRHVVPAKYMPVRFHIDDELHAQVTTLAETLGVSMAELTRAAVEYRLTSRKGLEDAVLAETFRDGPNRGRVIARHQRRMRQRAEAHG